MLNGLRSQAVLGQLDSDPQEASVGCWRKNQSKAMLMLQWEFRFSMYYYVFHNCSRQRSVI